MGGKWTEERKRRASEAAKAKWAAMSEEERARFLATSGNAGRRKGTMSDEERARLSDLAKERWATSGGAGFGRTSDGPAEQSAAGDKPPRPDPGAKRQRPPVGAPTKRRGQALAKKITQLVHFASGVVAMRDQFDGLMLASAAPKLGETYAAVLERHPKLLTALEQFEQGGVYGAAAIATLTVALPIAAHHNLIPPGPLVALANAMIPREVVERMTRDGQGPMFYADANGNPVAAAA